MATSNQDATQAEELQKMLGSIAQIKTKPDADLPYLIGLESMILTKLREPFVQAQQAAYGQATGLQPGMGAPQGAPMMPGPGPGMPPMPGGGGMPGGMGGPQVMQGPAGAGVAPGPGGGVAGLMGMPALPPIDELRRVLSEKTHK